MKKNPDPGFEDMWLKYRVTEDPEYAGINKKNYEHLKKLFEEVGVFMELNDGRLSLSVFPVAYRNKRTRNAGRNRKAAFKEDGDALFEVYRYSDVVYLLQDHNDREIMKLLAMPQATYYRHKKAMKESSYYKRLDRSRLKDREYLKKRNGDLIF